MAPGRRLDLPDMQLQSLTDMQMQPLADRHLQSLTDMQMQPLADSPLQHEAVGRIRHVWAERGTLCRTVQDHLWEYAADIMLESLMPIGTVMTVSTHYSHAFDYTTVHTLKRVGDNSFHADCYGFYGYQE